MIEVCLKSDYLETLTNFCSVKETHCLLLASLFHLLSLSSSNIHIKDINIHIKDKGIKNRYPCSGGVISSKSRLSS